MKNSHIDSCFVDASSEEEILFEVEYAVEQFLMSRFGGVESVEEMQRYAHSKIRINLSVQIMEEFN